MVAPVVKPTDASAGRPSSSRSQAPATSSTIATTAVCFGAVARVLRPYPAGTQQLERRLRHALSAGAMAVGGAQITLLLVVQFFIDASSNYPGEGDAVLAGIYFALLAFFVGFLTVVWGVLAALVRLNLRYRARASAPGGGPVGDDDLTGGPHPAGGDGLVALEQGP